MCRKGLVRRKLVQALCKLFSREGESFSEREARLGLLSREDISKVLYHQGGFLVRTR